MVATVSTERIVALIPAYNEGRRVRGVVEAAKQHLPVWVVDDGSSDDTVAHAEAAGARVIRQPKNMGKGEALKTGFRTALSEGFDGVVCLDADGQHDPEEIPAFLDCRKSNGADLIIGARDFEQMPLPRKLGNRFGAWLISWSIGTDIPDNQSGYRFVGRPMMEAMLDVREGGFEFEVEMIVVCVDLGFKLEWVPIRTIYEGEKSHISPLKHGWHFLRVVMRTRRRPRNGGPRAAGATTADDTGKGATS